MAYTVEDLLPISEKLQIPIVIDFHHDDIHPSSQKVEAYFKRVFAVWQARGIKPKVHVSNSVIGVEENASKTARRKHSDFIRFFHSGLYQVGIDIDVMLECKKKELAIFAIKNNEWCC
jgi:UV DNA damage endonuclease